jgi:quercetin dioxygenase-like cupin family protein
MRGREFAFGLCLGLGLASYGFAGQSVAEVRLASEAPVKWAPSGKARIKMLARGENAFIGMLRMEAGAAVPEHQDATEEYIVVVEGSGRITIDGQSRELSAGDAVFMPAEATVSYQNGDAPMKALQVFAGPEPAKKYQKWLSEKPKETP